jgi:hypothetical protein
MFCELRVINDASMRLNPPTPSPGHGVTCTVILSDRLHFTQQHYSLRSTDRVDIVFNFSGSAIEYRRVSSELRFGAVR